jgi:polyisoprenoid-binding protein YceI
MKQLNNVEMKKSIAIVFGILVTASTVLAGTTKGTKATFEIDTKESKVLWTGKKVTGEHTGYISVSNGQVMVDKNSLTGAKVNIDMNTIVCTDLKDEGTNKKFVGHLKSDDFFSVEKNPTSTFEITSVKPASSGEYMVKGNLTIKGKTNEISFPAKVNIANGTVKANGTASVDRTKWDIRYGSGKFFDGLGDKMIYDEFEITFEIVAKANDGLTLK